MTNLIDAFKEIHGLQDGEEFEFKGGGHYTYKVCSGAILGRENKENAGWFVSSILLNKYNNAEIKKTPWKPERDELYYTIVFQNPETGITSYKWYNDENDKKLLSFGLVFKTEREAQEVFDKTMEFIQSLRK